MALKSTALIAGYRGREVLHSVSLELEPGQLVCLLGPNGSGKSTLVRALCGILPLASGTVAVDGAEFSQLSTSERVRKIGFMPQEVSPGFSFSVREAVALGVRCAAQNLGDGAGPTTSAPPSWLGRRNHDDSEAAIQRALQSVHAEDLIDRQLDHLSGGERRRVLLASVLAQQPKYLLLDEPTAMLDLEHQVALFEKLAQLRQEQSLGILVVTHDINLAARWADQILLLKEGNIVAAGPASEVICQQHLESTFGPHFELVELRNGQTAVVPK
jgi:iron complex transport system ATP-binding protein